MVKPKRPASRIMSGSYDAGFGDINAAIQAAAAGMAVIDPGDLESLVTAGVPQAVAEPATPLTALELGKIALDLKVTDLQGQPIALRRASVRFAARLLTALTLGAGLLLVLFNPRRQALHDLLARSQVRTTGSPAR